MNYPFQFSTLFTLILNQLPDSFGQDELFFSVFNGVLETIDERRFPQPSSPSISRWMTGSRKIPAALADKCRSISAEHKIETDVRNMVINHIADSTQLIFQIIRLVREDRSYTAEQREHLLNYNPVLEKDHSLYLMKAVIASIRVNRTISFSKEGLLEHCANSSVMVQPIGNSVPSVRPYFVGRAKEKQELEQLLSEFHVVFLFGPRGIGKSALAADFAAHTASYGTKIWLTYEEGLKQTIESIILPDTVTDLNRTSLFDKNLRWLKSLDRDTLVILDNFDVLAEAEDLFFEFANCNFTLLITSHVHHEESFEYSVGEMSTEELVELFMHYYTKTELGREQIEEIIHVAYHHTMVVEMAAKLMQTSNVTCDAVVAELQKSVAELSLPVNVLFSKDGKVKNDIIKRHIQALYDLSDLTNEQLRTLLLMSYMPIEGVAEAEFSRWSNDPYSNCITLLNRLGWIERQYQTGQIRVHPIVREIVHANREEFYADVLQFTQNIILHYKNQTNIPEEAHVRVLTAIGATIADFQTNEWIVVQFDNACSLQDCGRKNTALMLMERLADMSNNSCFSSYFMTYLYYRIGSLKMEMARYEAALNDFETALSFEAGDQMDNGSYGSLLINCLLECALVFAIQNKPKISDRFMEFSKTASKVLSHDDYAEVQSRTLYKLGEIYRLQEKHFESLMAFGEALMIRDKLYGKDSIEAGLAHAQIGLSHRKRSEDFLAAKELYIAYTIFEKQLPELHPNLISVQLSLGIAIENITGKDLGIVHLLDYLAGAIDVEQISMVAEEISGKLAKIMDSAESEFDLSLRTENLENIVAPAATAIQKLVSKFTKKDMLVMRGEYGWKSFPSHHNVGISPTEFLYMHMQNNGDPLDFEAMKRLGDYHEKQSSLKYCHGPSHFHHRMILPNQPVNFSKMFDFAIAERDAIPEEWTMSNVYWYKILITPDFPLPSIARRTTIV